jgi:hypothetical protein
VTPDVEMMLDKIADFYDQEVEAATEQLTAMIEPPSWSRSSAWSSVIVAPPCGSSTSRR